MSRIPLDSTEFIEFRTTCYIDRWRCMVIHPYDLILTGLSLDMVGAVVLAKSFMLKNPQTAYYEALMLFGGNNHLLKSAIEQRAEARVGAAFLVAGFCLQVWGNLHGGIAATTPGAINSSARAVVLVCAAAVLGGACQWLAVRSARVTFYRIFFRNYSGQTKLNPQADDPTWFDRSARLLGIRRKKGESNEQLLARLEQRRIALGVRYGGHASEFLVSD